MAEFEEIMLRMIGWSSAVKEASDKVTIKSESTNEEVAVHTAKVDTIATRVVTVIQRDNVEAQMSHFNV